MNPITERVEFERCWPWLNASRCATCPLYTKEQIWQRLVTGDAFMWSGKNCVIVGNIIRHPIGFSSFNYWLQGGDLDELLMLHPGIEKWAVSVGCARVMGEGRVGWARKMAGDWVRGPTPRFKWLIEPPQVVRIALRNDT